MATHCYGCASKFNVFNKETGCRNCGFAFCKKCLRYKIAVPKLKGQVGAVCGKCNDLLLGKTDEQEVEPPDSYLKRVKALEEQKRTAPSRTQAATSAPAHQPNRYKGMSKKDIEIAERLGRLRNDEQKDAAAIPTQKEMEHRLHQLKKDDSAIPPPSEDDLSRRLANIQGVDPNKVNQPFIYKRDTRGQQQQIDDLLEEIGNEVELDSKFDPARDVQDRLNRLRSGAPGDEQNDLNKQPSANRTTGNVSGFNIPVDSNRPAGGEAGGATEPDLRQMDRLMREVAEEMRVDAEKAIAALHADKEIHERLEQLKDRKRDEQQLKDDGRSSDTEEDEDEEDEDKATKRLLKQLLEESRLDDAVESSGHGELVDGSQNKKQTKQKKSKSKPKVETADTVDPDELPWCCICNEDATLRCAGCDNDLYCQRCFREGHDRFDMQEHKTTAYRGT